MQGLQQAIIAAGTVEDLIVLAKAGEPIAYEALQILCYRNAVACEQIASAGICESKGWSREKLRLLDPLTDKPLSDMYCFLNPPHSGTDQHGAGPSADNASERHVLPAHGSGGLLIWHSPHGRSHRPRTAARGPLSTVLQTHPDGEHCW